MSTIKKLKKLLENEEFIKFHSEQSLIRDIAVQIEKIRRQQELSQIELAQRMGVDQAVISRVVNGKNFTLKTLEKFCVATNSKIFIVSV